MHWERHWGLLLGCDWKGKGLHGSVTPRQEGEYGMAHVFVQTPGVFWDLRVLCEGTSENLDHKGPAQYTKYLPFCPTLDLRDRLDTPICFLQFWELDLAGPQLPLQPFLLLIF